MIDYKNYKAKKSNDWPQVIALIAVVLIMTFVPALQDTIMNFEVNLNLPDRYTDEPTTHARVIATENNKIVDIVEFDTTNISVAEAKDILIERLS